MPWKSNWVVEQRLSLVRAMLQGKVPVARLCREKGVCRQTAYKYLARYEANGRAGLKDLPRANKHRAACTKFKRSVLMLRRAYPTWGARKLIYRLKQLKGSSRALPKERTVQGWLAEAGYAVSFKRKRHGRRLVQKPVQVEGSNHLWTVDFKGWFLTKNRTQVQPLTVRDHYSKYLLAVEAVPSLHEKVIRKSFERLFERYGLPKAILTDRGSPFCGSGPHGLTRLSAWWHRLGIEVLFVDRKKGLNNNAHEQMHQVMKKEVAKSPARTLREQVQKLEAWRRRYNEVRPHDAIGLRPPRQLYRAQPKGSLKLAAFRYPPTWKSYVVKTSGHIIADRRVHAIGRAFAGWPIGLEPIGPTTYRVHFGSLVIGQIESKVT